MEDFDTMIATEMLASEPADELTVYGLRAMFYSSADPGRRITVLIPWLTYSLDDAEKMRHEVARNRLLMDMALLRLPLAASVDITWLPMGVRVVELAEIPF